MKHLKRIGKGLLALGLMAIVCVVIWTIVNLYITYVPENIKFVITLSGMVIAGAYLIGYDAEKFKILK